jgi:MFS family permease
MLTTKRVIIATVCGFVFGIVCMLLASSNPNATESLSTTMKWMIVISRTMLGFTIGISAIRLNWWLHGIVLGAIASIPMAIPILDRLGIAIGTIVMGIIYGFLTEVITSIFFKAKSAGRS